MCVYGAILLVASLFFLFLRFKEVTGSKADKERKNENQSPISVRAQWRRQIAFIIHKNCSSCYSLT